MYSLTTQRQHDLEKSEFSEGPPSSSLHATPHCDGHNQLFLSHFWWHVRTVCEDDMRSKPFRSKLQDLLWGSNENKPLSSKYEIPMAIELNGELMQSTSDLAWKEVTRHIHKSSLERSDAIQELHMASTPPLPQDCKICNNAWNSRRIHHRSLQASSMSNELSTKHCDEFQGSLRPLSLSPSAGLAQHSVMADGLSAQPSVLSISISGPFMVQSASDSQLIKNSSSSLKPPRTPHSIINATRISKKNRLKDNSHSCALTNKSSFAVNLSVNSFPFSAPPNQRQLSQYIHSQQRAVSHTEIKTRGVFLSKDTLAGVHLREQQEQKQRSLSMQVGGKMYGTTCIVNYNGTNPKEGMSLGVPKSVSHIRPNPICGTSQAITSEYRKQCTHEDYEPRGVTIRMPLARAVLRIDAKNQSPDYCRPWSVGGSRLSTPFILSSLQPTNGV